MIIHLNYLACTPFSSDINCLEDLLRTEIVDHTNLLSQHHMVHEYGEQIIITPSDETIDYGKIQQFTKESDFKYEKSNFEMEDLIQKPAINICFENSLRFRSEYAIIDWEHHQVFYILLDELVKQLNINYWVSIND